MTISVETEANSKEDAEKFFQEMGIQFINPDNEKELPHNLVDWEISQG